MKVLVASLLLAAVAAGCSSGIPGASTALPSVTMTASAIDAPATPPLPAPAQTTTAIPTVVATATDDAFETPPIARLTLADGTSEPARLGSYRYRENFSDPPFWPTAVSLNRLQLADREAPMTVALAGGLPFVEWTARYANSPDHQAETVHPLGSGGAPDAEQRFAEAQIPAPPSGEWLLEISLTLPDGEGRASYYWLVAVP